MAAPRGREPPAEIRGHPVRPGRAAGTIEAAGIAAPDRVLLCDDLEAYLGDEGRAFAGLLGRAEVALDAPPPAGPPSIASIDPELLRPGDVVEMDGSTGSVQLRDVRSVEVVTAFLQTPDGRILLLHRSDRVGSFPGRWAGVSGYLEDTTPEQQAIREVIEETGKAPEELVLAGAGSPVLARDGDRIYVVHPFRFRVADTRIRIDWEHTGAEWMDPEEIGRRPTVPRLAEAWAAVAGPARPDPSVPSGKR